MTSGPSSAAVPPVGGPEHPLLRLLARMLGVLHIAAFLVLAGMLGIRPLLPESWEIVDLSGIADGVQQSTPIHSAVLDAVLVVGAIVLALTSPRRGWSWGAASGLALLALALVISSTAAHEKRIAWVAGSSLLIFAVTIAAVAGYAGAPWMGRVLLAVALAGGAASAYKCIAQRGWEFAETHQVFLERKAEMAKRGVDVTSPDIVNFERRLLSANAFGYLSHPNVAASCLMALSAAGLGLVALGVYLLRHREGDGATVLVLAAALVSLLLVAMVFTGSTGGLLAFGAGGAFFAFSPKFVGKPRAAAGLLLALYFSAFGGLLLWGAAQGTLPGASLAFRWNYWEGAFRAFQEAPLTGVGRLNFADAYMRFKAPEAVEEVRDPHNLWIALLVEMGPLGLLAGVLLAHAGLRGLLRIASEPAAWSPARPYWIYAGLAAVATLWMHALAANFFHIPMPAVIWGIELLGIWVLAFCPAAWILGRARTARQMRSVVLACAAAVVALLVHNLVDFSLLTPAGLSTLAAVVCGGLVLAQPATTSRPWLIEAISASLSFPSWRPTRAEFNVVFPVAGPGLLTAAAIVGLGLWHSSLYSPLAVSLVAESEFEDGLARGGSPDSARGRELLAAATTDPLSSQSARRMARLNLRYASVVAEPEARLGVLDTAFSLADTARDRNPFVSATYSLLANIDEARVEPYLLLLQPEEAAAATRRAALMRERAVELYPTDPRSRLAAARAWRDVYEEDADERAAELARRHLDEALRVDATRPPGEVLRLRPEELRLVEEIRTELPSHAGPGG